MIGLTNAVVRFGNRAVLDDLSFTAPAGRSLAILGPNGRGKTTALRAMLGFQALHGGTRTAPAIVGYVPQYASSNQSYRVLDAVVMGRAAGLGLFGQPNAKDFAAARDALEMVGASRFADERFDRLSGGERQLVLLARDCWPCSPRSVRRETEPSFSPPTIPIMRWPQPTTRF